MKKKYEKLLFFCARQNAQSKLCRGHENVNFYFVCNFSQQFFILSTRLEMSEINFATVQHHHNAVAAKFLTAAIAWSSGTGTSHILCLSSFSWKI